MGLVHSKDVDDMVLTKLTSITPYSGLNWQHEVVTGLGVTPTQNGRTIRITGPRPRRKWQSDMDRVGDYFRQALGSDMIPMVLGFSLWVATVAMAGVLASEHHGETRNVYVAVAVTTGAAGVTAMIDFWRNARWITPVTVASGMFALFAGQSVWAEDRSNPSRLALFIIQVVAVGIQFAAIANTPGRGPLNAQRSPNGVGGSLTGPLLELEAQS